MLLFRTYMSIPNISVKDAALRADRAPKGIGVSEEPLKHLETPKTMRRIAAYILQRQDILKKV